MTRPKLNKSLKKQQGVAIITALLIVTIAATISVTISTRMQLDVRRTANLVAQDQAYFYLLAAEEWSQRILRQDREDNSQDDLTEDWAIQLPPLPVEGGTIQGRITDLNSCININALLTDDGEKSTTKKRLSQLISNLGLNEELLQSLTDWIDPDRQTTLPGGAEDGYYLNLDQPYYTANRPVHSITELRLVKGFEDDKTYQAIKDHICAFTLGDRDSNINVNTASGEVLKSLSDKMTDSLVSSIIEEREENPFAQIKDFTDFSELKTIIKDKTKLSTSSDFFLLWTQAKIGQTNKTMYSIIFRDDKGNTDIIYRSQRTL